MEEEGRDRGRALGEPMRMHLAEGSTPPAVERRDGAATRGVTACAGRRARSWRRRSTDPERHQWPIVPSRTLVTARSASSARGRARMSDTAVGRFSRACRVHSWLHAARRVHVLRSLAGMSEWKHEAVGHGPDMRGDCASPRSLFSSCVCSTESLNNLGPPWRRVCVGNYERSILRVWLALWRGHESGGPIRGVVPILCFMWIQPSSQHV